MARERERMGKKKHGTSMSSKDMEVKKSRHWSTSPVNDPRMKPESPSAFRDRGSKEKSRLSRHNRSQSPSPASRGNARKSITPEKIPGRKQLSSQSYMDASRDHSPVGSSHQRMSSSSKRHFQHSGSRERELVGNYSLTVAEAARLRRSYSAERDRLHHSKRISLSPKDDPVPMPVPMQQRSGVDYPWDDDPPEPQRRGRKSSGKHSPSKDFGSSGGKRGRDGSLSSGKTNKGREKDYPRSGDREPRGRDSSLHDMDRKFDERKHDDRRRDDSSSRRASPYIQDGRKSTPVKEKQHDKRLLSPEPYQRNADSMDVSPLRRDRDPSLRRGRRDADLPTDGKAYGHSIPSELRLDRSRDDRKRDEKKDGREDREQRSRHGHGERELQGKDQESRKGGGSGHHRDPAKQRHDREPEVGLLEPWGSWPKQGADSRDRRGPSPYGLRCDSPMQERGRDRDRSRDKVLGVRESSIGARDPSLDRRRALSPMQRDYLQPDSPLGRFSTDDYFNQSDLPRRDRDRLRELPGDPSMGLLPLPRGDKRERDKDRQGQRGGGTDHSESLDRNDGRRQGNRLGKDQLSTPEKGRGRRRNWVRDARRGRVRRMGGRQDAQNQIANKLEEMWKRREESTNTDRNDNRKRGRNPDRTLSPVAKRSRLDISPGEGRRPGWDGGDEPHHRDTRGDPLDWGSDAGPPLGSNRRRSSKERGNRDHTKLERDRSEEKGKSDNWENSSNKDDERHQPAVLKTATDGGSTKVDELPSQTPSTEVGRRVDLTRKRRHRSRSREKNENVSDKRPEKRQRTDAGTKGTAGTPDPDLKSAPAVLTPSSPTPLTTEELTETLNPKLAENSLNVPEQPPTEETKDEVPTEKPTTEGEKKLVDPDLSDWSDDSDGTFNWEIETPEAKESAPVIEPAVVIDRGGSAVPADPKPKREKSEPPSLINDDNRKRSRSISQEKDGKVEGSRGRERDRRGHRSQPTSRNTSLERSHRDIERIVSESKRSSSLEGSIIHEETPRITKVPLLPEPKASFEDQVVDANESNDHGGINDYDSISDDELDALIEEPDEEVKADPDTKAGLTDSLDVDWSSLLPEPQKREAAPGSALQRFSAVRVFGRIGVLPQMAGTALLDKIKEHCMKQLEEQAASSGQVRPSKQPKQTLSDDNSKPVETKGDGDTNAEAAQKVEEGDIKEEHPPVPPRLSFKPAFADTLLMGVVENERRESILDDIGPYRRALCARRDLRMRRKLCKITEKIPSSFSPQAIDNEMYKLSVQLFRQTKPEPVDVQSAGADIACQS